MHACIQMSEVFAVEQLYNVEVRRRLLAVVSAFSLKGDSIFNC